MRKVDNFDLIRPLIVFPDDQSFYFLQVLKRRKDNPDLGKDMVHIADFYIYSIEEYDKIRDRVTKICEDENARAYLRLNVRDSKKIAMQTLKRIVDYISSENYKAVKKAYASCTGEFGSSTDKTWIVDIDNVSVDSFGHSEKYSKICDLVSDLQREAGKEPMMNIIPTKSGFHLITRPFNLQKFKMEYPDIDVHKDNPTTLYCP
jgi:hypothetical protein